MGTRLRHRPRSNPKRVCLYPIPQKRGAALQMRSVASQTTTTTTNRNGKKKAHQKQSMTKSAKTACARRPPAVRIHEKHPQRSAPPGPYRHTSQSTPTTTNTTRTEMPRTKNTDQKKRSKSAKHASGSTVPWVRHHQNHPQGSAAPGPCRCESKTAPIRRQPSKNTSNPRCGANKTFKNHSKKR